MGRLYEVYTSKENYGKGWVSQAVVIGTKLS